MNRTDIAKILQILFKRTDAAGATKIQHTLHCIGAEHKDERGSFELAIKSRQATVKVSLGETTLHYTVAIVG